MVYTHMTLNLNFFFPFHFGLNGERCSQCKFEKLHTPPFPLVPLVYRSPATTRECRSSSTVVLLSLFLPSLFRHYQLSSVFLCCQSVTDLCLPWVRRCSGLILEFVGPYTSIGPFLVLFLVVHLYVFCAVGCRHSSSSSSIFA